MHKQNISKRINMLNFGVVIFLSLRLVMHSTIEKSV